MTDHLAAIGSSPRPAGSAAAKAAQDYCAVQLESLGFAVTRKPFDFSALPGRYGAPILGLSGTALVFAVVATAVRSATAPVHQLSITAIAIQLALLMIIGGVYSTRLPFLREKAENLEAVRGTNPRIWLVAHIDSKSQPVSTALRTLGVILLTVAMATMSILWSHPPIALATFTVVTAAIGGGILGFCVVGNESDGAADNASGVAAVLNAAALLRADIPLGVLITDAEELFLAGAREWVRARPWLDDLNHRRIAINCDTTDDDGRVTIFRYQPLRMELVQKAIQAAQPTVVRVMPPPPGVLTDSVAFRRAGWQTVTLARGSLRTLARIHTRRDSLRELRGTGIPLVARAMATLVEELS